MTLPLLTGVDSSSQMLFIAQTDTDATECTIHTSCSTASVDNENSTSNCNSK